MLLPGDSMNWRFRGAQQKFGIIALPEYSGIPDRFFGMEPLLCREKIERIRTTLDFLKRNGIVSFREYHGWHQEEPEKGRWRLYHGEAIYEEASRRDISGFFFSIVHPNGPGRKEDTRLTSSAPGIPSRQW